MVMPRGLAVLFLLCLVAGFAGCVAPRHAPRYFDANNPVQKVALLPMKNDTTDVDGPDLMRKKMSDMLYEHAYIVMDTKESDQLLRDRMGITLGGQLDMTTARKLGEELGVQGVLYGTLMDFDETTTGYYNVRKVRATFKLVSTLTGQTVWQGGLGVKSEVLMSGRTGGAATLLGRAADARDKEVPWVIINSVITNDQNVGHSLALNLGAKLLTKTMGIHLDYEATELARRVTQNLPWGPGPEAVAITAAVPKERLSQPPPMIMPEPPAFTYLDYGKRSFSANLIYTTIDKKDNNTSRMEIPFARSGKKLRMDVDLAAMTPGGSLPQAMSKMTTIHRGDKKLSYTLYPNSKKYLVHSETENREHGEKPVIEKSRIGSEVVDKHPTDKYKIKINYRDGRVEQGFIWNAVDLDGMTIRSEVESSDYRTTTVLKNVVLRAPAASLFEVPIDYTEAQNALELMMDAK
jgi:hypothetical protein